MIADIITIGDELLTGERLNSNAQWLGRYVFNHHIEVRRTVSVGDRMDDIKNVLRVSMNEVDLVIVTGGLGPTHDDVTRQALQNLFQTELTRHEPTISHIREMIRQKGQTATESNLRQADVPSNCEVLFNERGTAPGMWFQEEGVSIAVLPGVPHEMKYLVRERVQPKIERLESWKQRQPLFIHYLQTAGVAESRLSDIILPDLASYETDQLKVAFLPHPGGVSIRINSYAESVKKARQKAQSLIAYIRDQAQDYIFNEGREHALNEALADLLLDRQLTVACAESCTGGLLMDTLTDVPGSSGYMAGGWVAYSNRMKVDQLNISPDLIQQHGAVSKSVALQMAKNAARFSDTDFGLSTTGIAGPSGGTEEKPVGTVWIGLWSKNVHLALNSFLTKERRLNKKRTVAIALDLLRRELHNIETFPYELTPHYG